MAKPSTKGLLKQILSDDIESVYVSISNKAVEWAIAGFIDEANILLEKLWTFDIPHSGHLRLQDEGLQILWSVSDKRPKNIPFSFKDFTQIEQETWSRVFYSCGDGESRERILSKPFVELNNQELFFKVINSGFDNSESPEDILTALKRFIKTENAVGYFYFHSTACGALLGARNNLQEEAEYFIKVWGEGYLKYWSNYMLAFLMRDRKCAAFLLNGLLAPVFELTEEKIQRDTREIIDELSKRMLGGRSLVYERLSWKELLDNISEFSIKQKSIDFSEAILKSRSLRKPPASKEEISEGEKRLNLTLPNDYKEFLLASNGLERFSYTGVTLAPVNKIDFLVKVDEELIDIWADAMDGIDPTFADKLRSSIVIGGFEEEQQLLFIPLQNDCWECWHFSGWRPGEEVYESFRFYMEGELQSLEDELYVD